MTPADPTLSAEPVTVPRPPQAPPTVGVPPVPTGSPDDGRETPVERGPLYVVGDVHGHLDELRDALREAGLVDADGAWCGGRSRLWFLGDLTDRGPDGIGVIELVMELSAQAAAAGGFTKALMGNHELLLLGAHHFGEEPLPDGGNAPGSFYACWLMNGGQPNDLERLGTEHIAWLLQRDAIAVEEDLLLVHSDTTAYLEYGGSVDEVNDGIHELLREGGIDEWWTCFRDLTRRFAFRDDGGELAAGELLDAFGGGRVVHGHSPIPYLLRGRSSDEPAERPTAEEVTGPYVYADGRAVAMDGGVTMAGPMLVERFWPGPEDD